MSEGKYFEVNYLEKRVCELLYKYGLNEYDAKTITKCLVEAESCGVKTHGLTMLSAHIKKLRCGYNLRPSISTIKEKSVFTVIDADNAVGMISATHCMQKAISMCESEGFHIVFCRNCNTYSAAFFYAQMALEKGFIGITFSNAPAQMPPTNGIDKLLGTNPLSIAVPCKTELPIIFDMATSIVAKSRINQALKKDQTIPEGWALDINGNPTTDPYEAVKGLILPMAGAKGYGLSITIDILSGVLSGSSYLDGVGRFYDEENKCMNVGQVFIAINPREILGEEFYENMDIYVNKIKNSKRIGKNEVRLPGENKIRSRLNAISKGIQLDGDLLKDINALLLDKGLNGL